jgi:hypothetical protein
MHVTFSIRASYEDGKRETSARTLFDLEISPAGCARCETWLIKLIVIDDPPPESCTSILGLRTTQAYVGYQTLV